MRRRALGLIGGGVLGMSISMYMSLAYPDTQRLFLNILGPLSFLGLVLGVLTLVVFYRES